MSFEKWTLWLYNFSEWFASLLTERYSAPPKEEPWCTTQTTTRQCASPCGQCSQQPRDSKGRFMKKEQP